MGGSDLVDDFDRGWAVLALRCRPGKGAERPDDPPTFTDHLAHIFRVNGDLVDDVVVFALGFGYLDVVRVVHEVGQDVVDKGPGAHLVLAFVRRLAGFRCGSLIGALGPLRALGSITFGLWSGWGLIDGLRGFCRWSVGDLGSFFSGH
jgi:hypothetical protein